MDLTDLMIKNAKKKEKAYKLSDRGGLYLLVSKSGGKYFRFDYRFAGKRKTLALGVYPDVSLKDARDRHFDSRRLLANGVDPAELKKQRKQDLYKADADSFEIIAREWFGKSQHVWSEKHQKTVHPANEYLDL